MNIVYGGAFNPPTRAHLEVYHFLKKHLKVKRFTYLPVSNAYTKSELASNYHRLNMLKIMTNAYADILISDLEIQDQEFLGTYQSLIRLSDRDFQETAFVIGADNLKDLKHWKMAESLMSEFRIIVLNREAMDINALIKNDEVLHKHKHNFMVFNDFDSPISSTIFRETLDESMVTPEVYEYIKKHGLYNGS